MSSTESSSTELVSGPVRVPPPPTPEAPASEAAAEESATAEPRVDLRDVEAQWQVRWAREPRPRVFPPSPAPTRESTTEASGDPESSSSEESSAGAAAVESSRIDRDANAEADVGETESAEESSAVEEPSAVAGEAAVTKPAPAETRGADEEEDDDEESEEAAKPSLPTRPRRRRRTRKPSDNYYLLDMFPYPSIDGFSVNQLRGIAISDVVARYRETEGKKVFRPIGWDSFGFFIETDAMHHRIPPQEVVSRGVQKMRDQLAAFGARVDWEAELRTSDPEFYRWTQWIFLKMFEHGLAVRQEVPIKWCEHCQTQLANEEAVGGHCVNCQREVEERQKAQWLLRITQYAERLSRGLQDLDWPDRVKSMQRNWIGRARGYELILKASREFYEGFQEFSVFIRRPEQIPGATYVVLAPEHPLVDELVDEIYRDDVEAYAAETRRLTERERLASQGVAAGHPTGAYALNPITLRPMPIWVSAFVLPHYGFGAVLGIPGHNELHHAFAEQHRLPIRVVHGRRRGAPKKRRGKGSRDDDMVMIASGAFTGASLSEARRKILQVLETRGVAKAHTRYNLRDWIFARQRFWGEPIPIVHCSECGIVPVPEDQLPVRLPEVDRIPLADSGESPLAKIEEFVNTECPKCGGAAERETDTMPQWAGACWYYLRYLSSDDSGQAVDRGRGRQWLPVDLCVGGIEHALLHLLYVRFFAYFLYDLGLTDTEEPFQRLFNQGRFYRKAPTEAQRRVATHRGDRIEAGSLLDRAGADALRLHLFFLGPPHEDVVWSTSGLNGCRRFLERAHRTIRRRIGQGKFVSRRVLVEKHRLIRRVTRAIETVKLNKAVSAFMTFIKVLRQPDMTLEEVDRATLKTFTILLAPFCPHLASELWRELGESGSVFEAPWPEFSEELLTPHEVEIPIFVESHLRDRITVETGLGKAALLQHVFDRERVKAALDGREPAHTIVVPDRLVKILFTVPKPTTEAAPAERPDATESSDPSENGGAESSNGERRSRRSRGSRRGSGRRRRDRSSDRASDHGDASPAPSDPGNSDSHSSE